MRVGGIEEPTIVGSNWSKLAMHCAFSCGSLIGPHSLCMRACRKPQLVCSSRSYCALSITFRRADQSPKSPRLACGPLVTSCVLDCACAGGIAPNAKTHPAAKDKLVTVLFIMTVTLLSRMV